MSNLPEYLSDHPSSIYGDNFNLEDIKKWFLEEENGFATLGYLDSETDYYPYNLLNQVYGWSKIDKKLGNVLSFGGAFAAEYELVAKNVTSITVIEPSKKFWRREAYGLKLNYVMPRVDGFIDFPQRSFKTITVFGVLHHIPNVSFVFSQLSKVIEPGGILLLREPIISMGDWSSNRAGLTKNERGIPLKLLEELGASNGFIIINKALIGFSPIQKFFGLLHVNIWNFKVLLRLDAFLCKLFSWNYKYHRMKFSDRFAPSNVFFVFKKI